MNKKQEAFTREIAPLLDRISKLAEVAGIPWLAAFELDEKDGGKAYALGVAVHDGPAISRSLQFKALASGALMLTEDEGEAAQFVEAMGALCERLSGARRKLALEQADRLLAALAAVNLAAGSLPTPDEQRAVLARLGLEHANCGNASRPVHGGGAATASPATPVPLSADQPGKVH